jgi:hypothetical protein
LVRELLAHGLIRASFVPERATQELRWLMRTRKQLVREQMSHVQRVQKVLEDANIKLDSMLSDILGASGRAMLEALIKGESDPAVLAGLAHRRVKADRQQLMEALRGHVRPSYRFFLDLHLRQIDSLDQAIEAIDRQVEEQLAPFRAAIKLLKSIPGVSDISARDHRRDRHRHEPLPRRRAPRLLGRHVLAQRRERRQAPLDPAAQGRSLAQDRAGAMRLGRDPREADLPAGPVLSAARPARSQKRLWSPSAPPSLRPSTTCCATAPSIATSGPTTSIAATPDPSPNAWSPAWSASATASSSRPPHEASVSF